SWRWEGPWGPEALRVCCLRAMAASFGVVRRGSDPARNEGRGLVPGGGGVQFGPGDRRHQLGGNDGAERPHRQSAGVEHARRLVVAKMGDGEVLAAGEEAGVVAGAR